MAKALLLTPGFRFHPTDVELVLFYLKRKVLGRKISVEAVTELDIYKHAPWDLPEKSCLPSRDLKWYFFCPRERKYACGARMNRATEFGYWKTTGKDRPVIYKDSVVGMIKTLVFHRGKAPKGDRTDWVMHEYRLEEKALADKGYIQDSYVLCMIFQKDGPGPRNGAQYGAPFREEEWEKEDEEEGKHIVTGNSSNKSPPSGSVLHGDNNTARNLQIPRSPIGLPSESCVSDAVIACETPCNEVEMEKKLPNPQENDVLSILECFVEDEIFMAMNGEGNNKEMSEVITQDDIFQNLEDLENLAGPHAHQASSSFNEIFPSMNYDDAPFLELLDLPPPSDHPAGADQYRHGGQ